MGQDLQSFLQRYKKENNRDKSEEGGLYPPLSVHKRMKSKVVEEMYTEPKYRAITSASQEELEQLKNQAIDELWKPIYHIHPEFGLLNDPNGLAYYQGKYRVFHQWYPFGTNHGMKHWAQLESEDLVNWKRVGVALTPTEDYESHGVYSGAALEVENKLYLYYTGNVKYDKVSRSANQCVAIMDERGKIEKYGENPLILGVPEGYTGHVRDPKVFKKEDTYYMFLGAQRVDETGTFLVYVSQDALQWTLKGELKLQPFEQPSGYMWECPDYAQIDGKDVLIFSPQGIDAQGEKYHNIFNVMYAIGKLDLENLVFNIESLDEMDGGFDFYAPQSFKAKGEEITLFAWAGMGEFQYPTDARGWAHMLTFPRTLKIKHNKIYQQPVKALEALRIHKKTGKGKVNKSLILENTSRAYELDLELISSQAQTLTVELLASEAEQLSLICHQQTGEVILDRRGLVHQFATDYGQERKVILPSLERIDLKILVDHSIVEIFINGGEKVFTTRAFPLEASTHIRIHAEEEVTYSYCQYDLKRGLR